MKHRAMNEKKKTFCHPQKLLQQLGTWKQDNPISGRGWGWRGCFGESWKNWSGGLKFFDLS